MALKPLVSEAIWMTAGIGDTARCQLVREGPGRSSRDVRIAVVDTVGTGLAGRGAGARINWEWGSNSMVTGDGATFPALRQVVLDTTDVRGLAEFYRQLLGLRYRPGDEPAAADDPDSGEQDWLVLQDAAGVPRLAFQQVPHLPEATWPEGPHPQMLHLDLTVATEAELEQQHSRALALGARPLLDRSDDEEEPLWVYADPAGHPFCIFVA
jgi:hypothetical protein